MLFINIKLFLSLVKALDQSFNSRKVNVLQNYGIFLGNNKRLKKRLGAVILDIAKKHI
jgi:hypothetical protein